MDQEFIRLMQILLGTPVPHGPTRPLLLNPDYAGAISTHVQSLNNGLKLQNNNKFIGRKVCTNNTNSSVIAPVVFASSGDNPVFAYFGLNPYFDPTSICFEKGLAGNDLNDYAAFYNSSSCSLVPRKGVFPYVFSVPTLGGGVKFANYYQNLFMIFNSLLYRRFISWGHFSNHFVSDEEKASYCVEQIKKCPIIVPELIPFHSQSSNINLRLFRSMNLFKLYQNYHNAILELLNSKMHSEGIIFAHGSATTDVLGHVLKGKLKNVQYYPSPQKITHTIAIWNGRIVIMLNTAIRSIDRPFNDLTALRKLINDILCYMQNHKKNVPCEIPQKNIEYEIDYVQ